MGALDSPPVAQGPALREAKLELRRRVLAQRDALPAAERARISAVVAHCVIALPSFERAQRPVLTLSFRSEFDTALLVETALRAGKRLALPRVDTAARMLRLHQVVDPMRDIAPGYLGIPEPRPDCPAVDPGDVDWVLVPGVAFDRHGHRLGYGGGFYDRLLPLVPRAAPRVSAAFSLQLVDAVPCAPHDLIVDVVVTESETIVVGR